MAQPEGEVGRHGTDRQERDGELRDRLDIVREVARERKVAFFDTYARWCDLEAKGQLAIHDLMADTIHSNAAAHRLVFAQLLELFPR